MKHRVDGPDGGFGYRERNFRLIQRCIHLSKRADQIRAPMVAKMSVIRSFRAAATTREFVQLSANKWTKVLDTAEEALPSLEHSISRG